MSHNFSRRNSSYRWQNVMRAERQKMPSVMEINTRKAQMRKAVFGVTSGPRRIDSDRNDVLEAVNLSHNVRWGAMSEHVATYSEGDVAKIVDARRKRNEAVTCRVHRLSCTPPSLNMPLRI